MIASMRVREKRDYMCFFKTMIAMVRTCPSIDSLRSLRLMLSTPWVPYDSFFLFAASVLQLRIAISTVHTRSYAPNWNAADIIRRIFHWKGNISRIYLYFIRGIRIFDVKIYAYFSCGNYWVDIATIFVCTVLLSLMRKRDYRGGPLLENIDWMDSLNFHCRIYSERIGNGGDKFFN